MPSPDFLPYGRQTIEEDDIEAVVQVLRGDYLTTGPMLGQFEEALAAAVGARYAVAVANGTAALHAACFAAGVSEGDEVIVPAITFAATANCARYLNADPIFADVDPDTGLMSPSEVERLVSERTRAVIPVHLTGAPAAMGEISGVARRVGAVVIEDAAHALGAEQGGRSIGSLEHSDMAIFSFHPVKHITTGEGGAIVTNDPALVEKLTCFRNHGFVNASERLDQPNPGPWYYEQQVLGHNLRLTDLQAALGISQLKKLPRFIARRRALAARYDELLEEMAVVTPVTRGEGVGESAYHLYAVLIDFAALELDRASVMLGLRKRGVGSQVHYIPVPMHPYYRREGWDPGEFPGSLGYYERTISLPLFPAMEDSDVDRVVEALSETLRELQGAT